MCTRRKGSTLDDCDVSRPGFDVDRGPCVCNSVIYPRMLIHSASGQDAYFLIL